MQNVETLFEFKIGTGGSARKKGESEVSNAVKKIWMEGKNCRQEGKKVRRVRGQTCMYVHTHTGK